MINPSVETHDIQRISADHDYLGRGIGLVYVQRTGLGQGAAYHNQQRNRPDAKRDV
jgi:hypothetical protein